MKQIQKTMIEELNVPKKQYEQPSIEVVELNVQAPLLQHSKEGLPDPDGGKATEEDWF